MFKMFCEFCLAMSEVPMVDYVPIPAKGWSIAKEPNILPMSTARGWTSYGL